MERIFSKVNHLVLVTLHISFMSQIRVWSKPDAINTVDLALDVAKRALEYYENFFKVSYPLPKLGTYGSDRILTFLSFASTITTKVTKRK